MRKHLRKRHLGGCHLATPEHPYGDPWSYTPLLWSWLAHVFQPSSVLDVGCGPGYSTRFFSLLTPNARGIDGLKKARKISPCRRRITLHDFTHGPAPAEVTTADLVWCCEFVEHVEEQYVDNFLPLLLARKCLAMTYAPFHRRGWHHVNCQPAEYWIEKVEALGRLRFNPTITEASYLHCPKQSYWWHTGLIFTPRS